MNNKEFFKSAGYGMMMHFGLYSMLSGEYRGQKVINYAEWIQSNFAIPIAEYEKLAASFNPIYFDADEIIKLAKDCGMKYFVVTTKHHDGFALFQDGHLTGTVLALDVHTPYFYLEPWLAPLALVLAAALCFPAIRRTKRKKTV